MTIQHKDIPDNERHEPKGITTAGQGEVYVAFGNTLSGEWKTAPVDGAVTAQEGQILRADGLGGVQWVYPPEGFGTYQHSTTQQFNTTYSKLLVDGAGGATITTNLPFEIRGTSQLWDVATSNIIPINEFDFYAIRIDLPVTAETGSPVELTVQMDIGSNEAVPTIPITPRFGNTGKALPYTLSFYYGFYTGATFKANNGRLFIKTNTGTLTTTNATVTLVRLTSGAI